MVYEFKKGAHVPAGVDAAQTYRELRKVEEEKGSLTAHTLADAVEAQGKSHPLSWAFDWDTQKGMRKLHEIQAGNLIRWVVVKEIVPQQQTPVRAFVLVQDERPPHYEPVHLALRNKTKRDQVLADARKELATFTRKMEELIELCALIP